jgi:hypothetical protein
VNKLPRDYTPKIRIFIKETEKRIKNPKTIFTKKYLTKVRIKKLQLFPAESLKSVNPASSKTDFRTDSSKEPSIPNTLEAKSAGGVDDSIYDLS